MKRKTNKKSGIIAAVVGLSAVSLVSVGFASWVMSGGDSASITDGQISVETVEDKRFVICRTEGYAPTVDYGTNKHVIDTVDNQPVYEQANSICFGIDDSTPIPNAWLTAGGEGTKAPKYENLTATVSFYVANLETSQTKVPSAVLAVVDNNTNGWATASGNTKNYVKAPADLNLTCSISASETHPEGGLTYRKVTAQIEFGWGTAFNYDADPEDQTQAAPVNPYVFYNHKDYDATISSTAKTVLGEIETLLTGVSFTVTITTDAKKA